ncbi:MAG TPA: DMT family transporter [Thermoanaerobaculia bacterium]|nr:DMT family transporter [Thermoanaerobaculia bacterium]
MRASTVPTAAVPDPPLPPGPGAKVHVALLLVQVCFGGFHVVAKALLVGLAPMAVVGLRVAIATPLLLILAWRRDRTLPQGRDWLWLALLGGLGVTANQILFILGLQHPTASNASILMTCLPVFAAAAGALMGIERLNLRRLLGIACAVGGALVMVNPGHFETAGKAAFGNLLILGNCLSYALFLVLQRPLLRRLPWRTVIAGSFLFGGTAVLIASLPALSTLDLREMTAGAWWGIFYIALFATVFAYAANTWAVRRSSPALVAAYGMLQPVVTAGLATAFLGETLGWAEAIGFVLIVTGLWFVSDSGGRRLAR